MAHRSSQCGGLSWLSGEFPRFWHAASRRAGTTQPSTERPEGAEFKWELVVTMSGSKHFWLIKFKVEFMKARFDLKFQLNRFCESNKWVQ